MAPRKLLSFGFFQSLRNNDAFYGQITDEQGATREIANHLLLLVLFAMLYGAIMGSYNGPLQAVSSALKMPALLVLIIVVCFPAFFVIQTVLGSKLSVAQMTSIILVGFVVMTCIMVSFSSIVIFFMITGDNYAFLKLLHVGIVTVAGLFGMRVIAEALQYSCEKKGVYPEDRGAGVQSLDPDPGPCRRAAVVVAAALRRQQEHAVPGLPREGRQLLRGRGPVGRQHAPAAIDADRRAGCAPVPKSGLVHPSFCSVTRCGNTLRPSRMAVASPSGTVSHSRPPCSHSGPWAPAPVPGPWNAVCSLLRVMSNSADSCIPK